MTVVLLTFDLRIRSNLSSGIDFSVSSAVAADLRILSGCCGSKGHANLLCIVPILSDVPEGTIYTVSAGSEFWRFRPISRFVRVILAQGPCVSVGSEFWRFRPFLDLCMSSLLQFLDLCVSSLRKGHAFPWDQSSGDSDQFLDLCVSSLRKGHAFPWDQSSGDSDHFSICACHLCAGAMLIFSVSFQFYQMSPKVQFTLDLGLLINKS
ncbi:hypothetical protein Tco_1534359 [Tanacetum coccineum]